MTVIICLFFNEMVQSFVVSRRLVTVDLRDKNPCCSWARQAYVRRLAAFNAAFTNNEASSMRWQTRRHKYGVHDIVTVNFVTALCYAHRLGPSHTEELRIIPCTTPCYRRVQVLCEPVSLSISMQTCRQCKQDDDGHDGRHAMSSDSLTKITCFLFLHQPV